MNRRLFLQMMIGSIVSTIAFKTPANLKVYTFNETNIPKEIFQELHQQYNNIYIELHKGIDANTQSFKINYLSDFKKEPQPSAQTYIIRGNVEGKTFRLRRIQEAGRILTTIQTRRI